MKAYLKIHHTNTMKVYLEDGSIIDIMDNPHDNDASLGLLGLANVIHTYHINTLQVEEFHFADPIVVEYIKMILTENYNYNEDFKIEVVE